MQKLPSLFYKHKILPDVLVKYNDVNFKRLKCNFKRKYVQKRSEKQLDVHKYRNVIINNKGNIKCMNPGKDVSLSVTMGVSMVK